MTDACDRLDLATHLARIVTLGTVSRSLQQYRWYPFQICVAGFS